MGVSATRYGVTHKNILLQCTDDSIQQITPFELSSRRPLIDDANGIFKEEMLLPYDGSLKFNPFLTISQFHSLSHLKELKSTQTYIESTSLLFGYGLDLFSRRLSPSNQFDMLAADFDYLMLILVLSGFTLFFFALFLYYCSHKILNVFGLFFFFVCVTFAPHFRNLVYFFVLCVCLCVCVCVCCLLCVCVSLKIVNEFFEKSIKKTIGVVVVIFGAGYMVKRNKLNKEWE